MDQEERVMPLIMRRLWSNARAATAIEYALLASLIAAAPIGATLRSIFAAVANLS
jgi:Flp pilus assembly pilin Flp